MEIQGKTAVITGASSGIGAATAKALAQKGAHVLLLARTQDKLAEVAESIIAANGQASIYPVDLSQSEAIRETAVQIQTQHGTPHILINNAGMGRWLAIDETDPAEARQMMAVPYFAAFEITRAFINGMLAQNEGHIVNITSPAAYAPW
ncbi:MAG: SDR family NAD(P)-dependent oxidoreductase, partial [Chloroflexi bacterium]